MFPSHFRLSFRLPFPLSFRRVSDRTRAESANFHRLIRSIYSSFNEFRGWGGWRGGNKPQIRSEKGQSIAENSLYFILRTMFSSCFSAFSFLYRVLRHQRFRSEISIDRRRFINEQKRSVHSMKDASDRFTVAVW